LNPNANCSCKYYVKFKQRDLLVATGAAFVIAVQLLNGWRVEWREIVLAGKSHGPVWWRPFNARDMEKLADGKHFQVEKIEAWGHITRCALVEPGVKLERELLIKGRIQFSS
jgi:hypothetical protein